MLLYYLSLGLAVFSLASYHLVQKVTPVTIHPFVSLLITYLVALAACLAALLIFPVKGELLAEIKRANWASYALGLTIFGAEIGFLLVYRSGWKINITSLLSNIFVALLLLPIGLFLFKEKLTAPNLLGVFLSIIGIILIALK